MKPKKISGFEELDHTADISLKVWAGSVEDLFLNAVEGFNHIINADIEPDVDSINRKLTIEGIDLEDLLISLLSEINYLIQVERLSTDIYRILIKPGKLYIEAKLKRALGYKKEVKAVTYHNLRIIQNNNIYSTVIVFDI